MTTSTGNETAMSATARPTTTRRIVLGTPIQQAAILNRLESRGIEKVPCPTPTPMVLDCSTQYLGNRVTRRFYPEHYAKVQVARWTAQRYGGL